MKETRYHIKSPAFPRPLRLALVSDLHAQDPSEVLCRLQQLAPDYILMPGDILERLDGSHDKKNQVAMPIFAGCAAIAPTFYSFGNHEDGATHSALGAKTRIGSGVRLCTPENRKKIEDSGVICLSDSYVLRDGIAFGGLSSGLIYKDRKPKTRWLDKFCAESAPKILLCHHPEYYEPYLRSLSLDLIVSGHAHGGQWRILGRGVFAPGQGLFPKYTYGLHDNRFVVSTGLKKGFPIPRFFNPPELCILEIGGDT